MAQDWAADVKKFVPDADDEVIKGLVRYCGIALQKQDSSLVSYTDPVELGRVRENFLKKKLGLTDSDEVLDKAIAAVGERMKGTNFKNRVTVYYLLLDHLGLHHRFRKDGAPAAAAEAPAASAAPVGLAADLAGGAAAAVGAVGAGVSGAVDTTKDMASSAAGAVSSGVSAAVDTTKDMAAGVAGVAAGGAAAVASGLGAAAAAPMAMASSIGSGLTGDDDDAKGSMAWLWWLLLGLLALALIWWFFLRAKSPELAPAAPATVAAPAEPVAAPDANMTAAVPEAAPVAIPQGAGIVSEMRDGKPLVKVFFDTGKAVVVPAFTPAAATLKTYLADHAGTSLGVSGYNDPTGNAAANAALSKNRAKAVQAALVAAGIASESIALVKPEAATDTQVSKDEARRVEVFIK